MDKDRAPTQAGGFDESDWFLQHLVDTVNRTDLELPITVQVAGLFVSGLLVSGKRYFEGFGDDVAAGLGGDAESAELLRSAFAGFGKIYDDENSVAAIDSPRFIHLRNARFFGTTNSPPVPNNKGVLWRGRLSQVGGFILGILEMSQQ
jgi:hypothetical protein